MTVNNDSTVKVHVASDNQQMTRHSVDCRKEGIHGGIVTRVKNQVSYNHDMII